MFLPTFKKKLANFETFTNHFGVLPLDMAALGISASIYQNLRAKGALLEDADILIPGITLAHGATLVTQNLKYFERIDGVQLESCES